MTIGSKLAALALPASVVALLGSQSRRVRWMEYFNSEEGDGDAKRFLRALVEPVVLAADFLEMAKDPFGFHRTRRARYGSTFVHGKCVVFTDYASVRRHMVELIQRKAHFSPISAQEKHPEGPVSGRRFLISVHDALYARRRRFLMEHAFRPSVAALDGADAVLKSARSVQQRRFDATDMTRIYTRILNRVLLDRELAPSELDLFCGYSSKAAGLPPWILDTVLRKELAAQARNGAAMREVYRATPSVQKMLAALTAAPGVPAGQPADSLSTEQIPEDVLLADLIDAIHFAGVFGMIGTSERLTIFLSEHPELVNLVRDEARSAAPDGSYTVKSLEKMERTSGVVWEAMRFYPTPMAVLHVAEEPFDATLRGRRLRFPAGTHMALSIQGASMDPTAFPQPERVILDRPVDSYLNFNGPLSGAPRGCLGARFGFILLKMFLVNWVMATS